MAYCDIHRYGDNIRIIEGQELIVGKQGDVAQIVLHRRDGILTLIDSGVYDQDRQAILDAARELGDYSKVVLINSHGHGDHVGNNDVIYELGAEEVEHYCPRKDYPNLCDQAGFFVKLMAETSEYLGMGSPQAAVEKIMAVFRTPRPNQDRVTMLEDRFELREQILGGVRFPAFEVGNVLVIPSEGHTVGHVCFLFPEEAFYYGADEFIGAVAPWGDSSIERQLAACRMVIDLVEAGVVRRAARGHHWGHVDGREFAAALQAIIDDTQAWNASMEALLQEGPYTAFELCDAMRERMPAAFGPNANPMFDLMKVINTCHRMGATATGTPPDTRFRSA